MSHSVTNTTLMRPTHTYLFITFLCCTCLEHNMECDVNAMYIKGGLKKTDEHNVSHEVRPFDNPGWPAGYVLVLPNNTETQVGI